MAAAAYRSGEKLVNEWDGLTHDYTRKGGVVHTEIMLPSHAPPKFQDRSNLWNSVEEIEKSSTAQLGCFYCTKRLRICHSESSIFSANFSPMMRSIFLSSVSTPS